MHSKEYMRQCIVLAQKGEKYTAPNPMVGCIIVHNDTIVAQGYHQKYGEAHAEVNAFTNLDESIKTEECDVYINLEPCSHYGKTPPCAELIVQKAPKKVIIGMLDPNPKVAGKGIKKLLEAGIDVQVGVLEKECKELNKKFIKTHTINLPYVTLKWAETKNGYMASTKGQIKISDIQNDEFVHHLRATHQAILVGATTVNMDNPLLDVRHTDGKNPIKIVLSENLSVDLCSNMFKSGKSIVYNRIKSQQAEHYELVNLGDLSLVNILKDLYSRDIHSVLIEGGPSLLAKVLSEKVWDDAIVLKSSKKWDEGIKAPWIGIPSVLEETGGEDTIKYFKNPL